VPLFSTRNASLLLLPASLLILIWLFPQIGYGNDGRCDPWYYFGLIANPAYTLDVPLRHNVSRVPLFLPTHLLYQIGDGAFVERYFYLAFTIVPLCLVYIGFGRMWNYTLAAFATILVFFGSLYVSVGSTTYSLPALSYGLSAIALYLIGSTVKKAATALTLFTLAAGALGAAFHANAYSVTVIFAIPILAYYSPLFWVWGASRFTAMLFLSGILGLVGSTLAFGLLNYAIVGRGVDVFLPQISKAFGEVTGTHLLSDSSHSDWYRSGPVIGLIVLCVAGLVQHALRFSRQDYRDLPGFLFVVSIVVSFAYFTFVQERYYFKEDKFYWFLLMPGALTLACLLRDLRLHVIPAAVLYMALITLMMAITYVNLALAAVFHQWWEVNSWAASLGLAIAILGLVMTSALSANRVTVVRNIALLTCLVLFFGFGHSTGYGREFFNGDRPSVRDRYDRIKLGINFIRDHYHGKFPNFWLADVPGDEAKLLFRSFVRCDYEYAYPYRLPDAELHRQQPIAEADGLIVVSNEATLSPSARATLAKADVVANVYQSKEISSGNVRYYVLLLDLFKLRPH
jgi:hypothetical protein